MSPQGRCAHGAMSPPVASEFTSLNTRNTHMQILKSENMWFFFYSIFSWPILLAANPQIRNSALFPALSPFLGRAKRGSAAKKEMIVDLPRKKYTKNANTNTPQKRKYANDAQIYKSAQSAKPANQSNKR